MFPALDFNSFTSNALVEIGWNGYFQTQLTPEKVKERKADIIAQAISLRGSITNEEVLFIESRLSLQAAEEDHERFRRIFFS